MTNKLLTLTPDEQQLSRGKRLRLLGPSWLTGVATLWETCLTQQFDFLTIDLSNVGFVTLFDWVHFVSLVELVISKCEPKELHLDFLGSSPLRLIEPVSLLALERQREARRLYTKAELDYSEEKYTLTGFLESLDTHGVLNRPDRPTKVMYPGVSRKIAALRSFHSERQGDGPKVVLGLQRIATKDDCRLFLSDSQILNWRQKMGERFKNSPLFENEEVWRVLCHELATNVWEHSDAVGYIAARVVQSPAYPNGKLRPWCSWTYQPVLQPLISRMSQGFLELCVADSGLGLVASLREALAKIRGVPPDSLSQIEVLSFAFDEIGTSKQDDETWATARHGLYRVLSLVSKYGGALVLKSADVELIYLAESNRFRRLRTSHGYEPSHVQPLSTSRRGAQFQLILPLVPTLARSSLNRRPSSLETGLPDSFHTQAGHFRGHLVPLRELLGTSEASIGVDENRLFRSRCEKIFRNLLTGRPRYEPLVFDFSALNWSPSQFERFLDLGQNLIQTRPTLMVEVSDALCKQVAEYERTRLPTFISSDSDIDEDAGKLRKYADVAEQRFLETYNRIHVTVLLVSRSRSLVMLGVPSADYEAALLELLDTPLTIEELLERSPQLSESIVRGILTPANYLFEHKEERWTLCWKRAMIEVEQERAILLHFESVAVRSLAWRGRADCEDTGREMFYIPWANVWRRQFLQASRILNRGRQLDEISQRLIFRMRLGLERSGKGLEDVRLLACISAPAMLLATGLHRWWPESQRPAVLDLGHYLFVAEDGMLPVISTVGGVVVVQDVLDDGSVTRSVVNKLLDQGCSVLLVVAFIKFEEGVGPDSTDSLPPMDRCLPGLSVPLEALVVVPKPEDCHLDNAIDDDGHRYWIEPRSLQPIKFSTLRRDFPRGRDPDLERRNRHLTTFEETSAGCLIRAGHLAYGQRHYTAAVDIRRLIDSEVGDEIAHWIADICEGVGREQQSWERSTGFALKGDVTVVLMPLYSQIHYLWPKIETILAQRGRRQWMLLLEPTQFSAYGSGYRLPHQLRFHIRRAAIELAQRDNRLRDDNALRILVLDDAVVSGKTTTTILAALIREVDRAIWVFAKGVRSKPIEWIRYFTILNQGDHASHRLWRNLDSLAQSTTKVVIEEYAPFMGVEVYDQRSCPVCRTRDRLIGLVGYSEEATGSSAGEWLAQRIRELEPVAIDGIGSMESSGVRLRRRLDILPAGPRKGATNHYSAHYVDTALWRFFELMALNYPPSEVLSAIGQAWPEETDDEPTRREYERFRLSVYEWCLGHWSRVVSDSAAAVFVSCIRRELVETTALLESVMEAAAVHHFDPDLRGLIVEMIESLRALELGRSQSGRSTDQERIKRAIRLERSLALFFLGAKRLVEASGTRQRREAGEDLASLTDALDRSAQTLDPGGHSLLRNLQRRIQKHGRFADPRWALSIVGESLYRGRQLGRPPGGSHKLLPKLLMNVLKGSPDDEDLRLLEGSVGLFAAALEELLPYSGSLFSLEALTVVATCRDVLLWLGDAVSGLPAKDKSSLRRLYAALEGRSAFESRFAALFHPTIGELFRGLERESEEKGKGRLVLKLSAAPELASGAVLTHFHRLSLTLTNRAVDPVERFLDGQYSTSVEVYPGQCDGFGGHACFRITTNFASADETERLLNGSRHNSAEEELLRIFGVRFESWRSPLGLQDGEIGAENRIYVPLGFPA